MKKIIISFFLFLMTTLSLSAQEMITMSGHVYNLNQMPISNHQVEIQIMEDSTIALTSNTLTGEMGGYEFHETLLSTYTLLIVSTLDCNGTNHQETYQLNNGNNMFTHNFQICEGENNGCAANFEYEFVSDYNLHFHSLSEGEGLSYLWDFGDGIHAYTGDPYHEYNLEGTYNVCLTITTSDSSCTDTYCEEIEIDGGGNNNCEANFNYEFISSHYLHFHSLSEGEELSYFWDFGDNTTAYTEDPYHEFSGPATYNICLTITSSDSSCTDTFCTVIQFGTDDSTSCAANFDYEIVSELNLHFHSLSVGEDLSYQWDFGDNTYAYTEDPYHEYEQEGTYNVCLTIMSADSSCTDTFCNEVNTSGNNDECEANFSYELEPNNSDYHINFTDLSSGNPNEWEWEFGDGTSSNEQNPSHLYNSSGYYMVCLHISGGEECSDNYCEIITVGVDSTNCMALFTHYQDSTGTTVHFIDQSIGNPTSWLWDFGDGNISDNPNPTHTYDSYDEYEVCLTISGEECTSTICNEISVDEGEDDCYNYFTYTSNGYTVYFVGHSPGENMATYYWEFGDGTSGTGMMESHTYENNGVYYVTLTTVVENCAATSSQNVIVGDSVQYNQVYGQVFAGDFPLELGMAIIFSNDIDTNYMPFVDVSFIDSSGVYLFPYVPNGEFYVYAIPMMYDGYLPTYYGDALNWEDATLISLGETQNPYNINLIAATSAPSQGNGSINGYISDSFRASYLNKVKVLLYNENEQPIGYSNVNAEGHFNFNSLASGTYYIKPELSGITSQMIQVVLNSSLQNAEVHLTLSGNQFLGTNDIKANLTSATIFPNPIKENGYIEFSSQNPTNVTVEVWNISGLKFSSEEYYLPIGKTTLELKVHDLNAGMYFVRIYDDNGFNITRKFIHQ